MISRTQRWLDPIARALALLLILAAACRSTPQAPPLSRDAELNAFAEEVAASLEAHAWQDLIAAADPDHYRTQVVDHGMPEPQYVAELFGLHRVDNNIERGDRVEWSDLERIQSVALESVSTAGPRTTLSGTVTLRDGSRLDLLARIVRDPESGRYALTGGLG